MSDSRPQLLPTNLIHDQTEYCTVWECLALRRDGTRQFPTVRQRWESAGHRTIQILPLVLEVTSMRKGKSQTSHTPNASYCSQ